VNIHLLIYFYRIADIEEKSYNKRRDRNSNKELQEQLQATIGDLTLTDEETNRTVDDLRNREIKQTGCTIAA
jgi:hypothetical protein